MCPTKPQKDPKGREDAESLWGTASERFLVWISPHAVRYARISMPHALSPTIGVGEEIKRKSKVRRACFLNKDRAVKERNV